MHSRSGVEYGGHNNRHLLTYLLTHVAAEIGPPKSGHLEEVHCQLE